MSKGNDIMLGCLGGLVLIALIVMFGTVCVLVGWNLSMPSLFGLKHINLAEAFGLMLLGTSLFKSSATSYKAT